MKKIIIPIVLLVLFAFALACGSLKQIRENNEAMELILDEQRRLNERITKLEKSAGVKSDKENSAESC